MKDFFSAFSSDFFWPLATLLLPGMLALTPGGIALLWLVVPVRGFVQSNHAETGIIIGVLATFSGLVLEDIGARLELWIFNVLINSTKEDSWNDWYLYLKAEKDFALPAHKYIHTMLLRLKFELGCVAAAPFALTGIWFWPVSSGSRIIATVVLTLFSTYLFYEAHDGVQTLAEIRAKVFRS